MPINLLGIWLIAVEQGVKLCNLSVSGMGTMPKLLCHRAVRAKHDVVYKSTLCWGC